MKVVILMNWKNKVILILVTVFLPLTIGTILYYIFCPEVWFVQKINQLFYIKIPVGLWTFTDRGSKFIRYYLFDFLWAFGLVNALDILCGRNMRSMVLAVSITTMLGAFLEYMQLIGLAKGTFDIFDIFAVLLGAVVGVFTQKVLGEYCNEKIR